MDYGGGDNIILQSGAAAYGCIAIRSRVRTCGHGLWPRLNDGSCLWHTAPLSLQVCGLWCYLSA